MPSQRPSTPRGYLDSQKSRAKNSASKTGVPAGELLQLHFHRRLIARVFHGDDASNWVLKGGQALLARWPAARYSTDVDLLSTEDTTAAAVEALKTAAALRLDDAIWFSHLSTSEQTHIERPTRKVVFMAMFENASLRYRVPVDVVTSGLTPRGIITTEPLKPPFASECTSWPKVRMFPIEDHVAEKICALYERHTARLHPSTRYKDLVDLALFALKAPISGETMHEILHDEITRRRRRGLRLEVPDGFEAPDPRSWTGGYRKAAQDVRELPDELRTLKGVHVLADAFITPLLQAEPPAGRWCPEERTWR
ncbi:nucleotidyl transferase AbiEii/AbiGii toxin family protein [Amycolatopsis sp. BJA-103]|uniref:nucleotidyl transferase AbiEii/AbiGii toxin family protein n=1 Tax=Amycolatopsis sp. BJA-103 TaxID=1911175 RepID=UPI000C76B8E2|nr:nucleotidyl transferase AbiEii/AbiGii toxin family protein [Amycolatopsis sp. BJA-103]AUI61909.1 histidinol-phosphate/aromatic aminotransferase and cobyric acid decarboxylase [Amycolatopsis sp. BJA-103]PNE20795.1 histidinol-phosphate/aromatic aminotransferase and cobyric acid decarboxylase [Amycolatopsis sp. BJA-103]